MRTVAIVSLALSAWTFAGPARGPDRITQMIRPDGASGPKRSVVDAPWVRGFVCAISTALLGWVVAGPALGVVGVPAGLGLSVWIGRLESPEAARAREEIDRDLPLAVDLLAACAGAGRPPGESLSLVSSAVGGALGTRLGEISARVSLGVDPASEWSRCAADPQLSGLARTMQRSAESGAPLVDGLTRLAEDQRRDRRTRTQVKARNVGVKAAGPLAACFLPAFMLVGVVPTVVGSFRNLFG